MVSIPDWSRFRRGPPPPSPHPTNRAVTPRERYIRAMEREAINEASRKGYFLEPDKERIIEEFGDTHGAEDPRTGLPLQKHIWHVNHIRYSYQHMKILGDIEQFTRITILTLDHNYLENIDSLVSCRELIKLDIHSNQISILPDGTFWSHLQKLRLLIAHDNPIARVEVIHSLVACSRLQILTLYDSPLALKKNYRHHVVNTLWSLKALDHHVVSDEEIIEDAVFTNSRFSTLGRPFEIDLCPNYPKPGATFEDELVAIRVLISRVNRIMAHYCPVLIIQKNIRYWLTHKRYQLYMESRTWASVTIQRAWRQYKNIPDPMETKDIDTLLVPTHTPESRERSRKFSNFLSAKDSHLSSKSRSSNQMKIGDRRDLSSPSSFRRGKLSSKRHLIVDLQKLQKISSDREDSLNVAGILAQAHMMAPKKLAGKIPGKRSIPPPPQPPGRKPLIHQKHFFGAVVKDGDHIPGNHRHCLPDTLPETNQAYIDSRLPMLSTGYKSLDSSIPYDILQKVLESNEEVPKIAFRLEGHQNKIRDIDRFEDNILSKKELGQDVRDMETAVHDKIAAEPVKTRIKKEPNVKDKFLFDRIQNTMTLSCLTAVQQAYRDRDIDEKNAAKFQYIYELRERRELAKERVKAYHEEKKLLALANRHDEKKFLKDSYSEKERQSVKQTDKSLANRGRIKAHRKKRDEEFRFAVDFRTQQTSVSKALLRHDRQLHNDNKLQYKVEKVEGVKDMEREQKEIVKKYLQHRQMMRQSENSMSRATLDTKMLQDANDRVYEAKSRVEHLKSRHEKAKQYTPVPQTALTVPQFSLQDSLNDVDDTLDLRRRTSKSMYQFYIPSETRGNYRAQTRLTLSGGNSRFHTAGYY